MVMGNSLREQLLKQGLVSKEQANQADKQAKLNEHQLQKKQRKQQKSGKIAVADTESVAYLAAQAKEKEIAHAKELNRQKEIERQQKALQAQVRDIIHFQYVNDPDAEGTYYFVEGKWVREIKVTPKQRQLLAKGELAITTIDEKYYLVPVTIAEKIRERIPEIVICFNKDQIKEEIIKTNDIYAKYPIPDDLIW